MSRTIQEFIDNGGEIKKIKTRHPSSRGAFISKDRQLNAMKALRSNSDLTESQRKQVDMQIELRMKLLKTVS